MSSDHDLDAAAQAARHAFYAPTPMTPWAELDERTQRRWRRVAREAIATNGEQETSK